MLHTMSLLMLQVRNITLKTTLSYMTEKRKENSVFQQTLIQLQSNLNDYSF